MKNGMYPLCSYCIWFKKETRQEARVILPDRYTDKEKSYCCTWQISQAEIRRQDELRLERSPVMDVRFERADVFDLTCFVFSLFFAFMTGTFCKTSLKCLPWPVHHDIERRLATNHRYGTKIFFVHQSISSILVRAKEVSHDKDSAESRVHTLYNLLTMDWVPH